MQTFGEKKIKFSAGPTEIVQDLNFLELEFTKLGSIASSCDFLPARSGEFQKVCKCMRFSKLYCRKKNCT